MKRFGGLVGLLLLVGLPVAAAAETVVRTGETVTVASDQTVEDDFYAAAGIISMTGSITEDMYAVGGSITINGPVGADLSVLGGTTQLHASVTDDVRVVGGEITLAEDIGGDVFVIGGILTILDSARVAGDVFFYGGEAVIDGAVGGGVHGMADSFRINGSVSGVVDVVAAQAVTLGDRAQIGGDVTYRSPVTLERSTQAVVEGDIVHNTDVAVAGETIVRQALSLVLVWLFATLTLFLLFREKLDRILAPAFARPALGVGVGLAGILFVPMVIGLLFVFGLSALIGLVGLLFYLLLLMVSCIGVGITAGALLSQYIAKREQVSVWWVLIGSVLVLLITPIPVLGQLAFLTLLALTFGTLLVGIYRLYTVD